MANWINLADTWLVADFIYNCRLCRDVLILPRLRLDLCHDSGIVLDNTGLLGLVFIYPIGQGLGIGNFLDATQVVRLLTSRTVFRASSTLGNNSPILVSMSRSISPASCPSRSVAFRCSSVIFSWSISLIFVWRKIDGIGNRTMTVRRMKKLLCHR